MRTTINDTEDKKQRKRAMRTHNDLDAREGHNQE